MKPVLITVGLDDTTKQVEKLVSGWNRSKLSVHTCQFGWQDVTRTTDEAMYDYLECIRQLYEQFGEVALVGVSAGGAASIWGAEQLPHMVVEVYDASGAVRLPRDTWLSRYFGSNGTRFDEVLGEVQSISEETRNKLTIIKPFLYDGLVRRTSFDVPGIRAVTSPFPVHQLAIRWALKHYIPADLDIPARA